MIGSESGPTKSKRPASQHCFSEFCCLKSKYSRTGLSSVFYDILLKIDNKNHPPDISIIFTAMLINNGILLRQRCDRLYYSIVHTTQYWNGQVGWTGGGAY